MPGKRLGAKIALSVNVILTTLLLVGAGTFIAYEVHEFREGLKLRTTHVMAVLRTVHVQAMLHRARHEGDDQPVVATLNATLDEMSKTAPDMKVWMVMGPKVLAYQRKVDGREIEPPRDAVDREALDTGRAVERLGDDGVFRFSEPVVLGRGVAALPQCVTCHTGDMGIQDGEPIGAYSLAFDTKDQYTGLIRISLGALALAIFVAAIVTMFSHSILNRLAGKPISKLTDAMRRLAAGDLESDVPHYNKGDEISAMAKTLEVFKDNAIQRRVVERELFEAKAAADRANRAKSEFLSSMSHELRTPLNAILGFAQLLEDDPAAPLTAEQAEAVRHIMDGGEYLLSLVNQVLDLSQIESGTLSVAVKALRADDVVRPCVRMAQSMAEKYGVSVIDAVDYAGLPSFRADDMRARQIMLNLLSNAVKYNHPGGTVTVAAEVTDDRMVRFAVTDSGPGIPADRHDAVFTPFNRLGAEFGETEGSGIGLSLTRHLIELLGGRIGFSSTVGKGSTFWVDFPIAGGL